MRKETKTIQIYQFNELDKGLQERILDRVKDDIREDNFECLTDDLELLLQQQYNLEDFDINYSFNYCQDDGLCFFNNKYNLLSYTNLKNKTNLNVFEKYILENKNEQELNDILEYLNNGYNIGIFKKDYQHAYARACKIDYESIYYQNDDLENKIYELCEELYEKVYLKICDDLEPNGYTCYDVTDGDALERIYANELEFLEDGSICY